MTEVMLKKLGLIVNPVAGMGGKVGLKGSDGPEILAKAIDLGAQPQAATRAIQALKEIARAKQPVQVLTYPDEMGENEARTCGFSPTVIGRVHKDFTTPDDTRNAALEMKSAGVDLILFAGGDGTARDIFNAVGSGTPALGIPAGVKIHSAVYGQTPKRAGELAALFLQGKVAELKEAEVMDIDEEAFRNGVLVARLYGYLLVPFEKRYVQNMKSGQVAGEKAALVALGNCVADSMTDDCFYIVGPGTTTRAVMERLGLENTLLGVDIVYEKRLVARDVNETEMLSAIAGKRAVIIVTIIGGQGYIFGRGNQQISPRVIKQVGKDNIMVIATRDKLNTIFGRPLLVDTGDEEVNKLLDGYYRVVVGYDDTIMYRVTC